MANQKVERRHREQAYLLIHERLSALPGPSAWIETGKNDVFGDFSMSARVAAALAAAEQQGKEAQSAVLAEALERAEKAEQLAASTVAFCRARIEQCADMDAQCVPHLGSFREGRVAAFLAVIARLDSASAWKP